MATKYSYSFRPRKQIQRQLIVDTCQRLRSIAPLEDFEYVGFGGFEFIDFDLFRRRLGIRNMVSYERELDTERYEFNRPFAEIELKFGPASQFLPFLDKARLRIVWLDYVSRLNAEVLQDVGAAAARLAPGSLLIVTMNSRPGSPSNKRRAELVADVGEERIPAGVRDDTLARWNLAATQRTILLSSLASDLKARGDGAVFEQVFNFRYSDGTFMSTIGGMIVTPGVRQAFESAKFEELDHVSRDDRAVNITAPPLTAKEALHLNRQIPRAAGVDLECPGIEDDDLAGYEKFYRWYPVIPAAI